MSDRLPIFIEPMSCADGQRQFTGCVELSKFPRLADLPEQGQQVAVILSFFKQGRIPVLAGDLKVTLKLQCRKCLQPLTTTISSKFKLGFVATLDEADLLPESYEPFLIDAREIALIDIIEEELLLSIPVFPEHDGKCMDTHYQTRGKIPRKLQSKADNPFSVLAKLKNTGD